MSAVALELFLAGWSSCSQTVARLPANSIEAWSSEPNPLTVPCESDRHCSTACDGSTLAKCCGNLPYRAAASTVELRLGIASLPRGRSAMISARAMKEIPAHTLCYLKGWDRDPGSEEWQDKDALELWPCEAGDPPPILVSLRSLADGDSVMIIPMDYESVTQMMGMRDGGTVVSYRERS